MGEGHPPIFTSFKSAASLSRPAMETMSAAMSRALAVAKADDAELDDDADGDGGGTHEQSIVNVLMSPPTAFGGEAHHQKFIDIIHYPILHPHPVHNAVLIEDG